MKLGKTVAMVVLAGSLAATGAWAKGGMMQRDCGMANGQNKEMRNYQGKMGQKGGGMMMLQGIDLTPEQVHEVKLVQAQMRVEMLSSVKPGEKAEGMKKAFNGAKFDTKAFVEANMKNAQTRAELKAKHIEKLYNILTPEQREKFVQNMQNRGPRS